MKTTDYCNATTPAPRWYNNPRFALLPHLKTREGDEHNTSGFTLHWLFLRVWQLDSPGFELSVVADTHWGIGLVGTLLYLRWSCCLPLPERLSDWSYKYLWRKPKQR